MAIFFGTMLPDLLYYKISLVTFSYEFISYLTGYYNSNEIDFYYKRSRPEYNNYVAELTRNIIKKPLNIVNFNHYISEISSFKVLAYRYPERLKNLLMCENISDMKRWCLECKKCGTYVLLSMCYENKYIGIDLNSFFENSGYIKNLIKVIDSYKGQKNKDNNYPWVKEFSSSFHYESHCHIIALIDIEKYRKVLSHKAFNNLNKIKDSYGNKKYPIHECFIEPAFRQVSPPLPEAVREIVTKYCPATEVLPDYFMIDKDKRTIDYNIKASIPDIFNINKR